MAMARENPGEDLKVVVIGGGSGTSAVLRGLKRYTRQVSAVVTMFDSGGSSGLLQEEFGYPPLGDLRQCLLGLSEGDEASRPLRELVDFRFNQESSLNGHSLGNLLLAALTTLGKDLEQAVDDLARMLRITGQVIPVSLDRADLCAVLTDGQLLRGESTIDLRRQLHPRIERVFLDPTVPANHRGIEAVMDADVVALGPGDLYTSIIPNFLVAGMTEALATTRATRVYVCNLMTKLGETDGFTASGFVREMHRYLGDARLDWALVNAGSIPGPVREAYRREGAYPVTADLDEIFRELPGVYAADLGNGAVPLQHRSSRVADAIINIAREGKVSEPTLRASEQLDGRDLSEGSGAVGLTDLTVQDPPPALARVCEPD
jgi:uncharacterized cofD-like protein